MPGQTAAQHGTPAKPSRSFSGLITVSPIEVSTPHERSMRRLLQILVAAAKDFTWPVMLALLAIFAQSALARRGERQQIFNTMLPTLNTLILQHYMPMARRMQTVSVEAKKIVSPAVAVAANMPARRTFAAILLMRKRVQHLFNSNGGIFFRSAIAEELFDTCLSGFYKTFQEATGDPDACESIALLLTPEFTVNEAYAQIFSAAANPQNYPLYQRFATWAVAAGGNKTPVFSSYLVQLSLAESVLAFECNRIYYQTRSDNSSANDSWYFDPPVFDFPEDIAGLPTENQQGIWKLYTKYLNTMPTQCMGKAKYPPRT